MMIGEGLLPTPLMARIPTTTAALPAVRLPMAMDDLIPGNTQANMANPETRRRRWRRQRPVSAPPSPVDIAGNARFVGGFGCSRPIVCVNADSALVDSM